MVLLKLGFVQGISGFNQSLIPILKITEQILYLQHKNKQTHTVLIA